MKPNIRIKLNQGRTLSQANFGRRGSSIPRMSIMTGNNLASQMIQKNSGLQKIHTMSLI